MAGFGGSSDDGGRSARPPKLPTWAMTDRVSGSDTAAEPVRAEPPVSRVPEHPFDVDDPFGDGQPGGSSSPWNRPPADDTEVRVVDLADEFHLTTAQALDVCAIADAPASSGSAWLTAEQADAFRAVVAGYDRTAEPDESFPSWAVPPGGRSRRPLVPPPAARPRSDFIGDLGLGSTRASMLDDLDAPGRSGDGMSRVFGIVLLVIALVAIAALVAVLLTR